jgi:Raf kinase inhibitor-like YbhB/YbcL family protein
MKLRSPEFADGEMIPKKLTCDGSDSSPRLEWSGVPESAQSLALICDDPDAPMGTWSHWVVVNLSPQVTALKEGVPREKSIAATATEGSGLDDGSSPVAEQGKNDFGNIGYGGPCPPGGTHRYFFRIYALDSRLELASPASRAQVLKAVSGHIVGEGRLMGKYQRTK